MLMKCKTCEREFIPPRKNISNCSKCIIFKKAKNKPEEESSKEESESEQNNDEKMKVMNKMTNKKSNQI